MWSFGVSVAGIQSPLTAINPMKLENLVHALPKIDVSHRRHFSETFPAPGVLFPVRQAIQYTLFDVSCAANQRHPRRLIEGFQGSDDRQQIEPFAPDVRFEVGGLDFGRAIERPQDEPPMSNPLDSSSF
jgi:hypothetical protein